MKILILLSITPNNDEALIRESTIMCCLAWCLRYQGHDVKIAGVNPKFVMGDRWHAFSNMQTVNDRWGEVVIVAGRHRSSTDPKLNIFKGHAGSRLFIVYKDSVGLIADRDIKDQSDITIAREYDPQVFDHNDPKLLPVPFPLHDRLIGPLFASDAWKSYLTDDVDSFRVDAGRTIRCGFAGVGHYGRAAIAKSMPRWCDWHFDDNGEFHADDYTNYMRMCQAVPILPGDTPKTNRFSEAVLFGCALVTPPMPVQCCPLVDETNSIQLKGWDDHEGLEHGLENRAAIVARADECYREGWSFMGWAKQLTKRLESL